MQEDSIAPQRAEVGATEGIAWELLWKLVQLKKGEGQQQGISDMVNDALSGFLKGAERTARTLETEQHSLPAQEGAKLQTLCQVHDRGSAALNWCHMRYSEGAAQGRILAVS